MRNEALIIVLILIMAGLVYYFGFWQKEEILGPVISNFDECVAQGNPVMESYPRQCRAGDRTFTEDIGNELEKIDLIRIDQPRPNGLVESPLEIKGEARGYWFFEADFPVKILDADGNLLGIAIAQAQSDWMTENFVSFEATLEFETPTTEKGTLVLEKDNPSGLPENADELRLPVRFNLAETATKNTDQETLLVKEDFKITLPPGWQEDTSFLTVLLMAIDTREEIVNEDIDFRTNFSLKKDDLGNYQTLNSAKEYTESVKMSLIQVIPIIEFTDEKEGTISGHNAFFIECESTQDEVDFKTLLVFMEESNGVIWALSFNTFQDSWLIYRPIFYQMAESFKSGEKNEG